MSLSRDSEFRIQLALDSAWADSTQCKYCGTITNFLNFCDIERVPLLDRCPASEHLLCAFATLRMGHLAGSTVQSHISALKAWHAYCNTPWNGAIHLKLVLNGVSNRAPQSSLLPPSSSLDPNDSFDCCCLAAATAAFWGQLRLGEILSPWGSSYPSMHISCRHHLSNPINPNGSRKLFLPFTKVWKNKGEEIILCRQRDSSDPILFMELHLRLNILSANDPLFSYTLSSGHACLTRRKFLARCNAIWVHAGFKAVTGHSFHIGGTTEMLLSGVPPDVIKVLGCWSSDSFLCYWHSLELLAPLHIENLKHCVLVSPPSV
ncbi:hypothetical protein CY34DRAFT_784259 [Suillus luteus UH-Slu-Lm8-n1]|uniref:Uncharacterized protein n=1 Tax=Suillus luteus UH-Slu-Lm8-n1 TaxID=930992 RepID=A0A0D0A3P8_9AGAM|nr:hypothetical protein CY34DRAFT_784259 [Suillus luteus UH-Slu-Lm8-n1]